VHSFSLTSFITSATVFVMQLSSMNEVIWNSSDWGLIKPTTDLNHESNLLVHRSTI